MVDDVVGREKAGTGTGCARHPRGRSGNGCLSPVDPHFAHS